MNIPDNTLDPHLLETIAHNRENCFRRCKILLAGFKATGEQDVDFMDTLMDACSTSWIRRATPSGSIATT